MMWDSNPWKAELWRLSGQIERRTRQRRWTERTGFLIEREMFFGFYVIRKLFEAQKLSSEIVDRRVRAQQFPLSGRKTPFLTNWDKVDQIYDLREEAATPVDVGLRSVCNEVAHSYVFLPVVNEAGGLAGLFLASDRQRLVRLLFIGVQEIVDDFRAVAHDDLADVTMRWDVKVQDYQIIPGRSM